MLRRHRFVRRYCWLAPVLSLIISISAVYWLVRGYFPQGDDIIPKLTINDCRVISLPKIVDPRGNLTFIEGDRHLPFTIQRVYYLYDVPGGSERGGHAHKALHQLIIAISGSFDVILDDGIGKKRFHLNRSYYGLYVCPMIWRELDNFSSASVCLVLASNLYDENDYFRDYAEYVNALPRT